jgi:hypothetical protein
MRDWIILGPDGNNYTATDEDFTTAARKVLAEWKKIGGNRQVGIYKGKNDDGSDKIELTKEFMDCVWEVLFSK